MSVFDLYLEQLVGKTLALFPGKFKPPHPGHIYLAEEAVKKVDEVRIIISNREESGVTAEHSIKIWNQLLKNSKIKPQIGTSNSPVLDVYQFLENEDLSKYSIIYFVKSTKDDEQKDNRFGLDRLQKSLAKNDSNPTLQIKEMKIAPLQNKDKTISSSDLRPLMKDPSEENKKIVSELYNNKDDKFLKIFFQE